MKVMQHFRQHGWPVQALLCLLFTLRFLLGGPPGAHAQVENLADPVTVQAENIPLISLIGRLRQQTNYTFSYDKTVLNNITIQQIKWNKVPLGKALHELSQQAGLKYVLLDRNIGISVSRPVNQLTTQEKPGALRGRVVDFETAQPLPGATVQLDGTSIGSVTDEKGYYQLPRVPAGSYTLVASFIGYQRNVQSGVKVDEGKTAEYDIKMQTGGSLKEVVIDGSRQRINAVTYSTEAQLLTEIRTARAVVSGISNEQIIKTADRNAAEIVKRISGVSVVDDKFIVVRGMNQRYNLTYLNDNLAPATEMYNRAFAYDMLPSPVIDRILVYKSPAAELFGDYAGGAVKVFTKNARPVRHLDIGFQAGNRAGTTLEGINTYKGGGLDWLGFDDGTRRMPNIPGFRESGGKNTMSQASLINSFTNTWQYERRQATPDMQFFSNYFDNWRIGGWRLYNLSALTYTYENRRFFQQRQSGNTYGYFLDKYKGTYSVGQRNTIAETDQSTTIAKLNLLQNFTLKINDHNSLEWKNFLLNDGRDAVVIRTSRPNVFPDIWEGPLFDRSENKQNTFTFQQRFLYNGNLGGNHSWSKQTQNLRWNLGYSYSMQNVPDQRITNFTRNERRENSPNGAYINDSEDRDLRWMVDFGSPQSLQFGMMSRLFVKNKENMYNASLDYSWKPLSQVQLKAGTYHLYRTREVDRRFFKVLPGGLTGDEPSLTYNPEGRDNNGQISPELLLFREQDLDRLWNPGNFKQNGTGLWLYDVSNPTDRYVATEQNNSGYLQGEYAPWNERLVLNGGLRFEHNTQRIAASGEQAGIFYPIPVKLARNNWLPSVNINYRPDSVFVIRASYGRTLNRPEFREIAPFADYDFINGENLTGNPLLKSTVIDNYDLRLELYPRRHPGESISIGAFYKSLQTPIERIRREVAGGYEADLDFLTNVTFFNPDKAKVYGLEMELRKSLSFIPGNIFRKLSVVANVTLVKSEVSRVFVPDSSGSFGSKTSDAMGTFSGRALQGQAPYVINGGLYYENPAWGTKLGLVYNVSGPSIYAIADGNAEQIRAVQQKTDVPNVEEVGLLNTRPSILELPRHLLDLSFTQRLYKSLQVRINIQNILDAPYHFVEDQNWNFKYDKEVRKPAVDKVDRDKGYYYYEGDNDFLRYNAGRYYTITFTYAL